MPSMTDLYANNPAFTPHEIGGIVLYTPTGQYHASRYVAASWQQVYSTLGATHDFLNAWTDRMLELCEDTNKKTLRTDIGTMVNNLKYRLAYPIDEDCAIRMGAIYYLLPNEPEQQDPHFYVQKMQMAKGNPELYAFFLTEGIKYTPNWKDSLDHISDPNYLMDRMEHLRSLTPSNQLPNIDRSTMTGSSKPPTVSAKEA